MTKKSILRIALVSAALLIIPVLGNKFVDGWNWEAGDFIFAFVFFSFTGLALEYAKTLFINRSVRIAAYIAVLLVMASIWVLLATG